MTENDARVLRALIQAQAERPLVGDWVATRQVLTHLPGMTPKRLARTLAKLERKWFVWRRIIYTTAPTRTGTFAGIGSMRRRTALYSLSPAGRDKLTVEE